MKIFIARTSEDSPNSFGDALKLLKTLKNTKIYLIGELGYDWELVHHFEVEGLVKPPKELQHLIDK